jgi:predicted nucleic acid-binding protein
MSDLEFLDTNVLVYAYDPTYPSQRRIAEGLILRAVAGDMVISTQVLAEFAAILLHKLKPTPRSEDVISALDVLSPIRVVLPDAAVVLRAIEARFKYGIHFYDGMIVAAAERAGCARIWSEDLNAGQKYFGVVVENPFR